MKWDTDLIQSALESSDKFWQNLEISTGNTLEISAKINKFVSGQYQNMTKMLASKIFLLDAPNVSDDYESGLKRKPRRLGTLLHSILSPYLVWNKISRFANTPKISLLHKYIHIVNKSRCVPHVRWSIIFEYFETTNTFVPLKQNSNSFAENKRNLKQKCGNGT